MTPRARPEAVVFDLDGTLIDSRRSILRAVRHALAEHGLADRDDEVIAASVGDGARLLLARVTGIDPGSSALDPVLETFLGFYTKHASADTRPMPEARATLDALAELPLAICTNKPKDATRAVLGALDLERCFSVVVAGGDPLANKPSPEPLLFIARHLRLSPAELVMVGDGPQDIESGRQAGAMTVAVIGNLVARSRVVAAGPDVVLGHLGELPALIRGWRHAHDTRL